MNNEIENFLNELTELSKKYKLYIDGCGCCNSPYIEKFSYMDNSSYNMNGKYVYDPKTQLKWINNDS